MIFEARTYKTKRSTAGQEFNSGDPAQDLALGRVDGFSSV